MFYFRAFTSPTVQDHQRKNTLKSIPPNEKSSQVKSNSPLHTALQQPAPSIVACVSQRLPKTNPCCSVCCFNRRPASPKVLKILRLKSRNTESSFITQYVAFLHSKLSQLCRELLSTHFRSGRLSIHYVHERHTATLQCTATPGVQCVLEDKTQDAAFFCQLCGARLHCDGFCLRRNQRMPVEERKGGGGMRSQRYDGRSFGWSNSTERCIKRAK